VKDFPYFRRKWEGRKDKPLLPRGKTINSQTGVYILPGNMTISIIGI
jgi:hypothetical protein